MSENNNSERITRFSSIISTIFVITIPLIVILISMKSGGFAPFGKKDIITASKTPEEIVYYYELYDKIHDSENLSFSNSLGMTSDFISNSLYHLSYPVALLILLFSRNSITTIINLLYVMNLVLCSLFFYVYLSNKRKSYKLSDDNSIEDSEKSKNNFVLGGRGIPKTDIGLIFYNVDYIAIAVSIAFPLSQFFVSEGLNLSYTAAITLLPLILLGIDRIIEKNRPYIYIIVLALSIIFNLYISIISLLFIVIYYIIESTSVNRSFMKSLKVFLPSTLISVLISMITTLPVLSGNDFHKDVILSFVRPKQLTNPWNAFSQLMFKADISSLTIYDGGVNLYIGILGLLACLCYIFNSNIKLRKRIEYLLLVVLLASGVIFSTPNYLLNGFRGFTNNTYIFGYLISITILSMTYHTLSEIKGTKKLGITISASLLMTLIIISMKLSENLNSINPSFFSMELLFVYFLIILVYRENSMNKLLFSIFISILFIGELSITYQKNMSMIGQVAYTRPTVDAKDYKIYQTIRYIHDKYNENASVLSVSSGTDSEPFITTLSGYDYIISLSSSDKEYDLFEYLEDYKEEGMITGISIYKNTKPLKSYLLKSSINSYHYNDNYPFESANIFTREYNDNKIIYTIIDGETEGNPATYSNIVNFSFKASEIGNAYAKAYNIVHIGTDSKIKPVSSMQERPVDRFDQYDYQYAILDSDVLNILIDTLASTTNNTHIIPTEESTIFSETNGYLAIPITYSPNLNVTVNGKKTNINRFINDITIIPINNGDNIIKIYYSNIYLLIGIIISLISVILFALYGLVIKNYKIKINNISIKQTLYEKSYVYILITVLLTVVFISVQMYTGSFPFGYRSTVKDDGLSQIYTVYVERAKQIKSSNTWSWISENIGLSRDTYCGLFLSNILHPFDLIKFKLLPESMYLFDFTLMYYLAFVLNGLSFIFYLTKRHINPYKPTDKKLVVLGSIYALSSYSVIMFNYECFRLMFYIPLIIWGMEKLIYDKKPFIYIIFLSCMMIYDAYPAFILCEFLCLIYLTYSFDNKKHFLQSAVRFVLSSIAAAGIAAFKLMPYFSMTTDSGYSNNDSRLPVLSGFFTSFIKLFSDYRPLRYMRAISSDSSDAAIYIGMLLFIFIPLYAINKKIKKAEKIKKLILLLLIYISFNSVFFNYIFHGFHYQSLVPNRFASIFIFISLGMIADILIDLRSYSYKTLIIILSVCSALYLALHILAGDIRDKGALLGAAILISTLIYMIYKYLSDKKGKISVKTVCYIMLFDVIINSAFLFSYNIGSSNNLLVEAESIDNLTSEYADITRPFEGSVYLNSSNYDISCMTDIESPVFFYSGASVYTLNMYTRYGIHHSLNTAYYGTGNPLADMMMHTRYHILSSYQNYENTWYPKVKTVNDLNVYENPYFLPLGFVVGNSYDSKLRSWDENTKIYNNLFDYNNDFFSSFSDSDVYHKIDLEEYNMINKSTTDIPEIDLDSIINQINYQVLNTLNNLTDREIFYNMITSDQFTRSNEDTDKISEDKIDNKISSEKSDIPEEKDSSYYKIGEVTERSNEQRASFYVPVSIHISTKELEKGSYYLSTANYILYIGEINNEEDINLSIDIPVTTQNDIDNIRNSLAIASLDKDTLKTTHDILNQSILTNISTNGRQISADLISNEDGKLYISLPYSENWKLIVDGNEVQLTTYLGGMGAEITKGNHSIILKYNPAGMKEGLIITFATILILLLLILKNRIKTYKTVKRLIK